MDLTKMSREELLAVPQSKPFNIWNRAMCWVRVAQELDHRLTAAEAELTRWQDWALDTRKAENDAAAEIARLRAIVDKLPKTADGVPVVPGGLSKSRVYGKDMQSGEECAEFEVDNLTVRGLRWWPNPCYSTREAAEAARLKP